MSAAAALQGRWIESFARTFALCGVKAGEACAVLSETGSRPELPQLALLGLQRLDAKPFHLVMPGSPSQAPLPMRSTGASTVLAGQPAAVTALVQCGFIADCTVEGLMHSAELPQVLAGGARVLYISHEHPETLERCEPMAEDEAPVREAMRRLKAARTMHVASAAGTDLRINLAGARVGGVWGFTTRPGSLSHWPGGLVLAFPAQGAVNGTLVLDVGDIHLGFKRYLESPVRLDISADHITAIQGSGLDAALLRSHHQVFPEAAARAVSHVGWGLNRSARWDSLAYFDKADTNGTEQRAFAGNFLYSTGANEVAGRHTLGHADMPLRHCTISLDGQVVVQDGVLV